MSVCPTHGLDCPGHLHAEVVGGTVHVSLPGTPLPAGDDHGGWEEVGFTAGGLPVTHPADLGTWDEVRTIPTTPRTVSFTLNNVRPDTVALLLGAPMPPPWKRKHPDTSIDLEKVIWTAHPYMHPLQRFGSFLLSDTEIRFLKDHGRQPW